jgi:hypothetical protein
MTVKNMPSGADSSPEERRIGALGDALKASDIADTRYLPITTFVEKNALFSHFRNAASPVSAGFDDRPATTDIHPSTSQSIATTGRTRAKEAKL